MHRREDYMHEADRKNDIGYEMLRWALGLKERMKEIRRWKR